MAKVTASVFDPVFADIMRGGHSEYWLRGGRGSTKSSFISIHFYAFIIMCSLSLSTCL